MLTRLRFLTCLVVLSLCFPYPSFAFDTPLSDTAVRSAYFLGQHHDETYGEFLDSYYRHLAPPESGPYVSSVAFLTPFALMAELSNQQGYGYSAQQAEIDHENMIETVKVIVEIQLTPTYGSVMSNPTGRTTGTPWDTLHRPPDFWRDFGIKVENGGKTMVPLTYTGIPNYYCGGADAVAIAPGEYCSLTGATVQMEFLAEEFTAGTANIEIDLPQGKQVSVDFDLYSMK